MNRYAIIYSRKLHRGLIWLAFFGLIIFIISAITHPLMAWTGPKAKSFFPPSMEFQADILAQLPVVLKQHTFDEVQQIKVVAGKDQAFLQLSYDDKPVRVYYSLADGKYLPGQDQRQAEWLASYYTGLGAIKETELVTNFSDEYPWVNRLLPVYKIRFNDQEQTEVYIHTETNQLASISNEWKRINRQLFVNLHTFSFLDNYPVLRVLLISLLMLSMLTLLLTGVFLLIKLKRNKPHPLLRAHRALAWLVFIPLMALLISGLYHLYFYAFSDNYRGIVLMENKAFPLLSISPPDMTSGGLLDMPINSISLIHYQSNWYYRISFSVPKSEQKNTRNEHFSGLSKESDNLFFDVQTGKLIAFDDKRLAVSMARQHIDFSDTEISSVDKIERFSMDYDFRNKRLPVYRVTLSEPINAKLFIDTQSGILVDRVTNGAGIEGVSFSLLHKWNFLRPFIDRKQRDVVIVSILVLILLLACMGMSMRFIVSR